MSLNSFFLLLLNFFLLLKKLEAGTEKICSLNPNTTSPVCSTNLFFAICSYGEVEVNEKWCYWKESDINVCCSVTSQDCCSTSSPNQSQQIATVIALSTLFSFLICCVLAFAFVSVCPSSSPRFLNRVLSRRTVRRNLSMHTVSSREMSFPRVVFPEIDPTDERNQCVVCYACIRETVLPCGHAILCVDCVLNLIQREQPCPTCRQPFTSYTLATNLPSYRNEKSDRHKSRNKTLPPRPETNSSSQSPNSSARSQNQNQTQTQNQINTNSPNLLPILRRNQNIGSPPNSPSVTRLSSSSSLSPSLSPSLPPSRLSNGTPVNLNQSINDSDVL